MAAKKKAAKAKDDTLAAYSCDVPVRKPGETRRRLVTVDMKAAECRDGSKVIVGSVKGAVTPDFAYGVKEVDVDAFRSAAESFAEQTAVRYGIPGDSRFE